MFRWQQGRRTSEMYIGFMTATPVNLDWLAYMYRLIQSNPWRTQSSRKKVRLFKKDIFAGRTSVFTYSLTPTKRTIKEIET